MVKEDKNLRHSDGVGVPINFGGGHIVAAVTGDLWEHIIGEVTSWQVRGHLPFSLLARSTTCPIPSSCKYILAGVHDFIERKSFP